MTELAELYRALNAAQTDARALEKTSKNEFASYMYASAEAVIAESRHALSKNGLAFDCVSSTIQFREGIPVPLLVSIYELQHISGAMKTYTSEMPIVEGKGKPADKSNCTARTYDLGYVLRSILLLPRVEKGSEVDQRDDGDYEPGKRSAPKSEPKPNVLLPKEVFVPTPEKSGSVVGLIQRLDSASTTEELSSLKDEIVSLRKNDQVSSTDHPTLVAAYNKAKQRVGAK